MSEFRNTRPNSPKGKVFTVFQKKGEKAARAAAAKLEIPNVRVNRWLKDDGAGFQNTNDAIKARKSKEPAPKKAALAKNGKDTSKAKTSAKKTAAKKTAAKKTAAKKTAAKSRTREALQAAAA